MEAGRAAGRGRVQGVIAMSRFKAAIAVAALVAVIGTPLFQQHRANEALREQNEALISRVSKLSEVEAENRRLSQRASPGTTHGISDEETLELARLRGEVTRLRADTNQTGKLAQQLDRLHPTRTEPAKPQRQNASEQDNFPRETWAYAGYASPESALQSSAWAAVRGDVDTFLKGMSPEEQARIRNDWKTHEKGDAEIRDFLINYWGQTKAVRIEGRQALSDSEAILTMFFDREKGGSQRMKMKVQRIGTEWKLAGPQEMDEDF
jgi:hypothetical protein